MRVLVTNDDGVHAPGILALARALVKDGHDVVVAAPRIDMSGAGAALGPGHAGTVGVERLRWPDLGEIEVIAVDGPPAMAVLAASLGAFGEAPEMVASGINFGGNTGRSVLFSGTVGAALAAANFGLRGVAVSQPPGDPWHLETGAAFGAAAVAWAAGAPPLTVLNVNVPNLPLEEIRGVRSGELAPFGVVQTVFEGEAEGRLQLVLRETTDELDPDTDTMLVQRGFVSVNALVGPRAVADDGALESLTQRVLSER